MSTTRTTGQAAAELGVPTWRVRRLFEDGVLPEPGALGSYRAIPVDMIGQIAEALRRQGVLPTSTPRA